MECDPDYTRVGLATSCLAGKLTAQTCEPASCSVLPPTHGEMGGCTSTLLHATHCQLACPNGFTLAGACVSCSFGELIATQYCLTDCGQPVPPDGAVAGTCTKSVSGNSGNCTLAIAPGYTLASGSPVLTCNDGQLSSYPTFNSGVEFRPDPCAGGSLCAHGICVPVVSPSDVVGSSAPSYALSCECPTVPIAWYGSTCSLAILDCVGCVASYAESSDVILYGVQMSTIIDVRVDGVEVSFTHVQLNTSADVQRFDSHFDSSSSVQALSFRAPALGSRNSSNIAAHAHGLVSRSLSPSHSYAQLELATSNSHSTLISAYKSLLLRSSLPGHSADNQLVIELNSLMFYSSSCLAPGLFASSGTGDCSPCPTGGLCPGGGRVWPQPGYWSWSEYLAPVRCTVPEACPGVDASTATSSASGTDSINTQRCADGYTGVQCAQCASSYFALSLKCYPCGSSVDQDRTIAITVTICFAFLVLLALLVALLKAMHLALAMQVRSYMLAVSSE
jgi:hypothetical protein